MNWGEDFAPTDDERVRLIRREDASSIPAVQMVPDGTPSPLRELSTTPSGRVGPNRAYYFRVSEYAGGMQTMHHGTAGNLLFVGEHPNPVPLPRESERRNWDIPPQTVAWPRVVEALGLTTDPAATQPIATAAATPTDWRL